MCWAGPTCELLGPHGRLVPAPGLLVVNGRKADRGQGLHEGDEVHLTPPISGGALALVSASHEAPWLADASQWACAEVKEVMPK